MFDKMKQLMEFKKQADQIKKQLDSLIVEVEDVPGIKVTITGSQNFKAIQVNESHLGGQNKTRLEMDLLRSVNAAIKKSQQKAAEQMRGSMPNFPGM
jgi:DNA-binding YbaB/EbfC family protein